MGPGRRLGGFDWLILMSCNQTSRVREKTTEITKRKEGVCPCRRHSAWMQGKKNITRIDHHKMHVCIGDGLK